MSANGGNGSMSRAETENLQRLIRQREKVLKSAARMRSAELLADFENEMGSEYHFDDNEVWAAATRAAEQMVEKCNAKIAAECAKLGIPARFAPRLSDHWWDRGENMVKERRKELRIMAESRVEAIEKAAFVQIELDCLTAQTEIATQGLTSDAAKSILERLPAIATLMPALSYAEIAGEADPPVVEQLVSPNALRQRRYRERHRNAAITSPTDEEEEE